MAFTFQKMLVGLDIGGSLHDDDGAKIMPSIVKTATEKGVEIFLPIDFVTSPKFNEDGETTGTATMNASIPEESMGLKCGPKTIK